MASALTALHVAILFIAAALFIGAAVSDAYAYRIPNYMCAALVLMFPFFVATAPAPFDWWKNAAVFGLVAIAGFALFLGRVTGAGDVKLLAAASLWAGPNFIAVMLLITAFAGGIESIVMAVAVQIKRRQNDKKSSLIKLQIPYGVAIATGGLTMLGMMARPFLLPG